ncbi:MAG: TldD/PmbA family protein [Promethearchaeati archaeon]
MAQKSYEEILSIFDEISKNYKRKNQYFDILYDSIAFLNIRKTPSEETISISKDKSGIVARTYTDRWKEFAFDDLSDMDKVEFQIPKVSSQDNKLTIQEGWKINKEVEVKIDPKEISLQQKIEKIRSIFESFKKYDERIINPIIAYSEILTTRIFVNNEGCQLRQVIPRTRVFIQPIAKEEGTVDFDYHSLGGEIGFEIFKEIENKLEEFAQNSLDMLKADKPPSGKYPIILDPDMAGLIAHESFGHGLEADQILRDRSYLKDLLNKQVASKISNIYDAPNISNKYGSYFFDDEGIKAEKNFLVENGILKNFIHNRLTASELNTEPKGNGRRESYAHPLHVRMTNTYFGSGDYELDEMISEIKKGVILNRGYFGMEDPLGGGLQVTSKKGYLIENGEKTKLLKATTLSGSVLKLLKNINAISKDDLKLKPGTCGKGYEDFVPVTSGGSYIRVKTALISPG